VRHVACKRLAVGLLIVSTATFAQLRAQPGAAAAAGGNSAAIDNFKRQFGTSFLDRYWQLHTDDAIFEGYFKVADLLIVPDETARKDQLHFLQGALARLQKFPEGLLDAATGTDRAVLENQLRSEIWSLTQYRIWEWDPAQYNVAEPFALLLNTEYAPLEARLRAVLARLKSVPAYYAAAKQSLKNPTREHTQLAIEQNNGALDVFGSDLEQQIAAAKLNESERALFKQRISAARASISDYVEWLKALDARLASGSRRSFRLGRELYEQQFALKIASGTTAEGLYQRAINEKERLLIRMDLLSDQLWPKYFPNAAKPEERLEKIGTLIGKLSEQHIASGDFFREVQRTIPELEQWVMDHHLLTLDLRKPLEVRITPKYKQGIAGASFDPPGPYDADARSYFNVTPLDELSAAAAESYLREYNRWILPVLAIHEAVPGHYVQSVYANKSSSLIKSVFFNDAMVEGWAVYAERMMLESGFGNDTGEQWLMYTKWNLRSVCNTILDYGVHVLGTSKEAATQLLMHECFQSEQEATGKWRRVTLTSVQLTSYFAGYSAIYDFRERLKREQGGGFDLQRFNERFLGYGNAPVNVIEQVMEKSQE
jgi:uncharacterized protein (DUF885 family)